MCSSVLYVTVADVSSQAAPSDSSRGNGSTPLVASPVVHAVAKDATNVTTRDVIHVLR